MKKINRRNFIEKTAILGSSAMLTPSVIRASEIFTIKDDFDVIIKNGTIIDGTGGGRFKADVGIYKNRIKAIGKLKNAFAPVIIDASGLIVSPGFIDIHTHTDLGIFLNPKGESKIRQGVTTEIGGQCGDSFAPIAEENLRKRIEYYSEKYGLKLKDRTFEAHLDMIRDWKFSVNQGNMVGLGTIRDIIVGMEDRRSTADEIKRMKHEIIAAINGGAVGISSGLEYTPGSFATTEELIELSKAMPEGISKLYATHIRNEDDSVEEAVSEAIKIARVSGARLEISHLKASGKSNWHKADALLEMLDKAAAKGLDVHADRYTYVAYQTGLANLFPLWARDGGDKAFIRRLRDKSNYEKLKDYSQRKTANLDGEWNGVVISSLSSEKYKFVKGMSVAEIANRLGAEPFDTAVELLVESNANVGMIGYGMSEKSTEKILTHPRVMIASDASAHAPYPPMNNNIAHPRAYGTFPRAIAKYVKEREVCSLEEMIKKMTAMPADKIGIKDRGRIAEGKKADITIFNYDTIEDNATFIDSAKYPSGIEYVIVNGKIVIDKGMHTGKLPGEVITV